MAAATKVLRSFSSTGSEVILIQPSSSGAERNATAFSALTRCGSAGRTGMGSNSGSSTAGASAFRPGIAGVWVGAGAISAGATAMSPGSGAGPGSGLRKKSSAGVSTASGTTGLTMARGAALRSGSMPNVPPGPRMTGSMGSLPPSFTWVWSGPRSMSKGARGPGALTWMGSNSGAG
ncbi:unknown [Faecalibacterium sp. CAG:82]|nr:unknown [Faecalibacterium sp. CAG:82]